MGRPKKQSNNNIIIKIKRRDRGRPRKYPIKELIKEIENQGPILDLSDLIKNPKEFTSLWGYTPK